MANVRGARGSGDRPLFSDPIVEEFVPSSGWTQDSDGHYLLVDLPEFQKEEVKLQVDTSGVLTFSGERQTSDKRYILRFHQTSTLPPDSDINRITGKFDSGILYVTVPKLIVQQEEAEIQKKEDEDTNGIVEEHKQDDQTLKDDENDSGDGSHVVKEEREVKKSRIDDFPEETLREWQEKPSQLDRAVRMLIQNKQIVFTALLAFALGVWVTRKIGSGGHVDAADI